MKYSYSVVNNNEILVKFKGDGIFTLPLYGAAEFDELSPQEKKVVVEYKLLTGETDLAASAKVVGPNTVEMIKELVSDDLQLDIALVTYVNWYTYWNDEMSPRFYLSESFIFSKY